MKSCLIATAAAALFAAGCAAPPQIAVIAPYRIPRDGGNVQYRGAVNHRQTVHMRRTVFPRLTDDERLLLRKVNREVNNDITYLSDLDNYGVWDRQVTEPAKRKPVAFGYPRARYGDCEDYALTKKHRLVQRGMNQTRLFAANALVQMQGQTWRHTVLVVPEGRDWLVLNNWDNIIDRASSLERRWGWQFVWPDFKSYWSTRDPYGNLVEGVSESPHERRANRIGSARYAAARAMQ